MSSINVEHKLRKYKSLVKKDPYNEVYKYKLIKYSQKKQNGGNGDDQTEDLMSIVSNYESSKKMQSSDLIRKIKDIISYSQELGLVGGFKNNCGCDNDKQIKGHRNMHGGVKGGDKKVIDIENELKELSDTYDTLNMAKREIESRKAENEQLVSFFQDKFDQFSTMIKRIQDRLQKELTEVRSGSGSGNVENDTSKELKIEGQDLSKGTLESENKGTAEVVAEHSGGNNKGRLNLNKIRSEYSTSFDSLVNSLKTIGFTLN
jgi:hypothetical protein